MGNLFSKKNKKHMSDVADIGNGQVMMTSRNEFSNPADPMTIFQKIIRDEKLDNLNKLRDDLIRDPATFVLNNLILSIQFFENFERDKELMQRFKIDKETGMKKALADQRRKCLYEGALSETIGTRYRYLPKGSSTPEVTSSIKYNIIYQNLEVYPSSMYDDLTQYSSVDEPIYRFCVEYVPNTPGWVMLRCVDPPAEPGSRASDNTYDQVGNDSDDYSKLSDYANESIPEPKKSDFDSGPIPAQPAPDYHIRSRPPMTIPEHSSEEDDDDEVFPTTGKELLSDREKYFTSASSVIPVRNDSRKPYAEPQYNGTGKRRDSGVMPFSPTENHRLVLPRMKSNGKTNKEKSNASSSEDDYDYTSVNDIPRQLQQKSDLERLELPHRDSSIPTDCFQSLRVQIVEDDNPHGIGAQFEWKRYFSSQSFFQHFTGSFFQWGERMGLNGLGEATAHKAAISCSETQSSQSQQRYRSNLEFVPVLPVPQWPETALEWRFRDRPQVTDPRTKLGYIWPTRPQVDKIINRGCYLVAEGGKIGGHRSPNTKLEWKLSFANARQSLISSLSQQHLSCLLWIHLIFRHYLAPLSVLSLEHVESVFFRAVERNYIDWPDMVLGERVKMIFKELYESIKRGKLRDYFVANRNMLHSKAERDRNKAQDRVWRLLENFLPLVIQSTKQLQGQDAPYPLPDLNQLWMIVTTKLTLDYLNPNLALLIQPHVEERVKEREPRNEDRTRQLIRQERARREAEKQGRTISKDPNAETMKIDTPIGPFNVVQTKLLLEFFIKHFIAMAQQTNKCRAYGTSNVLLNQAENLTTILAEEGHGQDAEQFKTIIETLQYASRLKFTSDKIHIPGSPSVFPTGFKGKPEDRAASRGRLSSRSSNPLPELPEQFRTGSTDTRKEDQNELKWVKQKTESERTPHTLIVTADIEGKQSSEDLTDENSNRFHPFNTLELKNDSDLGESTDF